MKDIPSMSKTPMSLDERMFAVVEAIYDAAMDESRWPEALQQLMDFTGSQAASFWVLDGSEEPRLLAFTYINFEPKFIQEYLDHTAAYDPWNRYLVAHRDQMIVHDGIVIAEQDKDRHPYFGWHESYSDARFRLIGQVSPAPLLRAGVALHRTCQAGRYEPEDIQRFEVLYGHLQRGLAIGCRLGSLGALQQCTLELMDRNPAAILLIDERKRVVYANRKAEMLGSAGDGIRLSKDGVRALRKEDNVTLQCLITRALSAIASPCALSDGAMRVQRPSGKRPYAILVSPVSTTYSCLAIQRPAACIVITDPARETPLPHDRLKTVFDLTDGEARLAALLAAGEDLRSSAETLKITYGTARARLMQIFQKTDTRRQGELIKLLLTMLAAIE
jgi:DNA-binding CsgD family transcriptional regulator